MAKEKITKEYLEKQLELPDNQYVDIFVPKDGSEMNVNIYVWSTEPGIEPHLAVGLKRKEGEMGHKDISYVKGVFPEGDNKLQEEMEKHLPGAEDMMDEYNHDHPLNW